MKPVTKKLLSIFLSVLLLLTAFPALAHADESALCTTLLTSSCSDDHLQLSISGSKLTVSGTIFCSGLERVAVVASTAKNSQLDRKIVNAGSGKRFTASLTLKGSDEISISVYTFLKGENQGSSYEWGRIRIEKQGAGYAFSQSAVAEQNKAFLDAWINPADWTGADVSDEVKELSKTIIGSISGDYAKCFKLNKWVAENIYYDLDNYNGSAESTPLTANDVLLAHKSVCAGYAGLLAELLNAQGIPAFTSSVYALGTSSSGGSFAGDKPLGTEANHAIVEAFADGRWIIMDPTWDSNNICENNEYKEVSPNGFYYFDVTPEAFALDHQYFQRGPVTMENGQIVNRTDAARMPSSWAQGLVAEAMKEGLVPAEYQKYYNAPISRASMCRLAVEMIEAKSGKTIDAFLQEKKLSTGKVSFADTTDETVLACKVLGIVDGTGKDSKGKALFSPTATLTRAQAAVISSKLAELFGVTTTGYESSFPDVPNDVPRGAKGHWSAPYVGWAASADIVSGTADGNFNPDGTLTLEQAIIILYKTLKATE